MALQIRGIHHIGLTVSDPNRSARFSEKVLDLKGDYVEFYVGDYHEG